jgi:hypothetical protein
MLTKASLALVAALVIASTSNGFAAQKNRFDFDFPNSTFPTPCHEGPRAAHAVLAFDTPVCDGGRREHGASRAIDRGDTGDGQRNLASSRVAFRFSST